MVSSSFTFSRLWLKLSEYREIKWPFLESFQHGWMRKPRRCSALWSSSQFQWAMASAGDITEPICKLCSTQVSQTQMISPLMEWAKFLLAEKLPVMLWPALGSGIRCQIKWSLLLALLLIEWNLRCFPSLHKPEFAPLSAHSQIKHSSWHFNVLTLLHGISYQCLISSLIGQRLCGHTGL